MEVKNDPPDIFSQYSCIELQINVLCVNGTCFLQSVSTHIYFQTAKLLFDKKAETLLKSLGPIIQYYVKRDFCVVVIFGNNQFGCLHEDFMRIYQIVLNRCASNEHDSIIKIDNKTLKEILRCTITLIPFQQIPDLLTAELIYSCTFWINCHCF